MPRRRRGPWLPGVQPALSDKPPKQHEGHRPGSGRIGGASYIASGLSTDMVSVDRATVWDDRPPPDTRPVQCALCGHCPRRRGDLDDLGAAGFRCKGTVNCAARARDAERDA